MTVSGGAVAVQYHRRDHSCKRKDLRHGDGIRAGRQYHICTGRQDLRQEAGSKTTGRQTHRWEAVLGGRI
jgi:hypothetical protein